MKIPKKTIKQKVHLLLVTRTLYINFFTLKFKFWIAVCHVCATWPEVLDWKFFCFVNLTEFPVTEPGVVTAQEGVNVLRGENQGLVSFDVAGIVLAWEKVGSCGFKVYL